jgi:ABC-2 type transport system ATP-binding protein
MNAIEVSGLEKRFGPITAIGGIDFSVRDGETFGFLGPNGAGKTTTIRILTGVARPTKGRAAIFGHDVVNETLAAKKHLGIVTEVSNIYDDLTGWQNVAFAGSLYNVPRAEIQKRGTELLEQFGLLERQHDRAKGYSKGMKRRLCIAMGLVNAPRLLFLDEPTSGLDVQSNLIIRQVIRDLNREGVTIFLTTHNIEEANLTCERVAIINHGQIAAIDTPERLKRAISSVQSVEVAFDRVIPSLQDDLTGLPGVNELRKEGDKFRLLTSDPPALLLQVMDYAHQHGLAVIRVCTLGPTLEDVFIRLTGIELPAEGKDAW